MQLETIMEQPSPVNTAERTPSTEPASRREVISAVNEVASSLYLGVQIAQDRQRRGLPLSEDQVRQQHEYQLFADSRRAVLRQDSALPQNLISDVHMIRFEDPVNHSGPGYLMQEGIDIRGLLPQIDRIIERRRNLPPEEANLDHYTRLKQVLLENSKPFTELYFPGKSEQELMGDPAFYARTLYGARQRLHGTPASEDQIANWIGEERDLLRRRIELVLPIELKGQPLPPETPRPEPVTVERPLTDAEIKQWLSKAPRVIWRQGVRVIRPKETPKVKPAPLIPGTESPKPSGIGSRSRSEIPRFPNTIRIPRERLTGRRSEAEESRRKVAMLGETNFAKSLRVDPKILALILALAGLSALLPVGPRQYPVSLPQPVSVSGPIFGPPRPFEGYKGKGPYLETYDFGEPGHSLEGLAVAQGAYLDNKDLVKAAKDKGEEYKPDLAAKMSAQGGTLPPDDPDLLAAVQKAQTEVPWWQKFIDLFKKSTREYTYNPETGQSAIEGDKLPQKVTVVEPETSWEIAKQEYLAEKGLLDE